jgi:Tol biopolymer transport system component
VRNSLSTCKGVLMSAVFMALLADTGLGAEASPADPRVTELAAEVHDKGWVVFGARSESGDWDLYLMRPDGSSVRNITNTPDASEAAPRFSPDGKRLLYRRLSKGAVISHDLWGFQGELVIANADGSAPAVFGGRGEYPWASWSPDGKQIACLTRKGVEIVDLADKRVVRGYPRQGLYQQLFWSPDGKWFCGVANHLGQQWTIARMNAETGELNAVSKPWACTPDWLPDSKHIIFSHNPAHLKPRKGPGWTQLWMADGNGTNPRLIYGQDRRHVYGGATSPDGKYVLLTMSVIDGGLSEWSGAPMALMRMADAPTIGGSSHIMRELFPKTKDGPVLTLPIGWEPHWTYAPILP